MFAALQCQIEYGNYNPQVHKPDFLKYSLIHSLLLPSLRPSKDAAIPPSTPSIILIYSIAWPK